MSEGEEEWQHDREEQAGDVAKKQKHKKKTGGLAGGGASSTWALIGFCVAFTLLAVYFGVAMPEQNEARVKELYRPFPQASTRSAPGTRPMTTGAQLRQRPGPPHRK